MTEAELVQNLMASGQAVSAIFSTFFTIACGYLVALFYFLCRAPAPLKLLAFGLLSVALAFLGAAMAIQQGVQAELLAAMGRLPAPTVSVAAFTSPAALMLPRGLTVHTVGAVIGWFTALASYVALGYLTFVYRWRSDAIE